MIERQMSQDQSDSASEEINQEELLDFNRHLPQKRTKGATRMSQQMDALYKSALMNVIFGQFEEASQKLKHLITLYPDNPQPYYLIGTMYEETGDLKKALQYFFINTYLSPPNLEKWVKVADKSMELKMYDQAAYCYGRALKIANYNVQLALKRANAFELGNRDKQAVIIYKRILKYNKSLVAIKRYARLRFNKGEYSSAREILMSYDGYMEDKQLLYMVSQTLLKENSYKQLSQLIKQQENKQEVEPQFLRMMYISAVANKQPQQKIGELQKLLEESYDEEDALQFEELLKHLIKLDEERAYNMINLLLNFQKHRTVGNYLFMSQYFIKKKELEKALSYINEGISKIQNSTQLQSQLNYICVILGKNKTNTITRSIKNTPNTKLNKKQFRLQQKIYESDSGIESQPISQQIVQKQNFFKNKTRKHIQINDKSIISQLLTNAKTTLFQIISTLQNNQQQKTVSKYFRQVNQVLDLLSSMTFQENKQVKLENKSIGLLSNYSSRKGVSKLNINKARILSFLTQNQIIIYDIVNQVISYLKMLLLNNNFRKTIFLVETLIKVIFFRKNNKNISLNQIKAKIYQIGVLACLNLRKFNRALFFMRYLISKNPHNTFYVILLGFLSKNSSKKNFLGPMFRKFVLRQPKIGQELFNFLLALQYIETSEYQVAIDIFMRIYQHLSSQYKQKIHLYCASSFLQIASSRNTYNKMDYINRSAYELKKYIEYSAKQTPQVIYNIGRWFSHVKINQRAIFYFEKVLALDCPQYLKKKSAYNLMCIYKQIQQFDRLQKLSQQFFKVQ